MDALLDDPRVQAVSFVGSTPIAETIYARGCANGKRVQALGGAKNHLVVMPDADMSQAANALLGAGYGSAGERCMAISLAVCVGDATADALIEQLQPMVTGLRIGPGDRGDHEMGPLVTAAHRAHVLEYVDAGVAEGAPCWLTDGSCFAENAGGFSWVAACLTTCAKAARTPRGNLRAGAVHHARAGFRQRAGPVNSHEYGNGCAIFTRDGDCARQFAHLVGVGWSHQRAYPGADGLHSFGGGTIAVWPAAYAWPGWHPLYTRLKTITARWPTACARIRIHCRR